MAELADALARRLTIARRRNARLRQELSEERRRNAELVKLLNGTVRDNHQLIASLLTVKASRSDSFEVKRFAAAYRIRLNALALPFVQQDLCGPADKVDLAACLSRLAGELRLFYRERRGVGLRTTLAHVRVEAHRAQRLGLIAAELVSNAFEHAFSGRAFGTVELGLASLSDTHSCLWVADNGRGLEALDSHVPRFSGLQVVDALARKLNAQVSRISTGGARISLSFANGPG